MRMGASRGARGVVRVAWQTGEGAHDSGEN